MGFRRTQVLECNIRTSAVEGSFKAVGWTDDGYYVELLDGHDLVGNRLKTVIQDLRRSFAVADVIVPGKGRLD